MAAMVVPGARYLEHQPGFCNSCHEMNRPHAGWVASGASQHHPDCIQCHSGPGITGVVEAELRGVGQLIAHFSDSEKELQGPFKYKVPREFCTQCHSMEKPQVKAAHTRFQEKMEGRPCGTCHKHQEGWEFAGEIRSL